MLRSVSPARLRSRPERPTMARLLYAYVVPPVLRQGRRWSSVSGVSGGLPAPGEMAHSNYWSELWARPDQSHRITLDFKSTTPPAGRVAVDTIVLPSEQVEAWLDRRLMALAAPTSSTIRGASRVAHQRHVRAVPLPRRL